MRIDYIHSTDKELKSEGLVGMTILPGRKDRGRNVSDDIESIQQEKIGAIVTLLSESEFTDYGVAELRDEYNNAGLELLHIRVPDQSVPTSEEMKRITAYLHQRIKKKEKTLVHCVGGLGRTGTVVACYLKEYEGFNSEEAIETVRESRSRRAIENERQENFVKAYN